MRTYKLFILIILGLVSTNALAFDPAIDCNQMLNLKTAKLINGKTKNEVSLQNYLVSYTANGKWNEIGKFYALCFEPTGAFELSVANGFTITATPDKPLIIYGLNLSPATMGTSPLLTLSGSNVTIDHAIFTTTGSGTVIQINGNNMRMLNSTLAGPTPAQGQAPTGTAIQVNGAGAVIGPKVAITNFATGIEVKQGASVNITQDSFTSVAEPVYWIQPFWQADPITVEWLGKHVSDADANVVDRIAGKVDVPECTGSVDIYLKTDKKDQLTGSELPLQYKATCPVMSLKDKKVTFKTANNTEKDIPDGACYFDCEELKDIAKYNYVSFSFTSAQGITSELMPMPDVRIDGLDIIWVPLAPEQTGGTNNANPGDGIQYIDQTNLPNTDNKNQVTGNTGPSGAGPVGDGPTGFGASGCSLIR